MYLTEWFPGLARELRYLNTTPSTSYIAFSNYSEHDNLMSVQVSGTISAPTVSTQAASGIGSTSATLNGNVTSDGGAGIIERGFCIGTSANPTTSGTKLINSGTTGAFSGVVAGLNSNTAYHVRAYAINSVGTSYGTDVAFTTTAPASGPWYVSKNGGSDTTGSGTFGNPWQTIQHALNMMVAGPIYARGGVSSAVVYNEMLTFRNSGSASNPLILQAYPGELVTIDGTGKLGNIIDTNAQSHLTVDGFAIKNAVDTGGFLVGHGIWAVGHTDTGGPPGSDLVFQNLVITNTQLSAIIVCCAWKEQVPHTEITTLVNNVLIKNVTASFTNYSGWDEAFSLKHVSNCEVAFCTLHDMQQGPHSLGLYKEAIGIQYGSQHVSVHHTEAYNALTGVYINSDGWAMADVQVYCSKLHDLYRDMAGEGVGLADEAPVVGSMTGILVYNNLIWNNHTGFYVDANSFRKTFTVINNTFYNNKNVGVQIWDLDQYQLNCVVRNNICYLNGDDILYNGGTHTHTADDHNLVGTNPLFVNAAAGDFHLQANSPAIGAGVGTLAPPTDMDNNARPQNGRYDIGAYEYVLPGIQIIAGPNIKNVKLVHV
jgi:hypothetical protein